MTKKAMNKREARKFILRYIADELDHGILETSEVLTDRSAHHSNNRTAEKESRVLDEERKWVIERLRKLADQIVVREALEPNEMAPTEAD